MNVVIVSNLSGNLSEGPSYSVPKQATFLNNYDNVFWYNLNVSELEEWNNNPIYHDLTEYPKGTVKSLPAPFCNPDIVIVEMFYKMAYTRIPYELFFRRIPYVIVPRGEFTQLAQKSSAFKKKVCNFLFFSRFARKAKAIHFLTHQEYIESPDWNQHSFIVPNGVFCENSFIEREAFGLNCISIGRLDIEHKGIDLLVDACSCIREKLKKSGLVINLFGPGDNETVKKIELLINNANLNEVIRLCGPIYGSQKEEVLKKADAFIITSRYEGHPTALIEALSFGLPALATRGSNMGDEIEMFKAGWVADNNADSISKKIIEMIDNHANMRFFSENARNLSLEYDWNSLAKKNHEQLLILMGGK